LPEIGIDWDGDAQSNNSAADSSSDDRLQGDLILNKQEQKLHKKQNRNLRPKYNPGKNK